MSDTQYQSTYVRGYIAHIQWDKTFLLLFTLHLYRKKMYVWNEEEAEESSTSKKEATVEKLYFSWNCTSVPLDLSSVEVWNSISDVGQERWHTWLLPFNSLLISLQRHHFLANTSCNVWFFKPCLFETKNVKMAHKGAENILFVHFKVTLHLN